MSSEFYRVFEDRHRGPRNLIKERLKVYLPFVKPLLIAYPSISAIDLGCGRGEWLELMTEIGVISLGVDVDKEMLSVCANLNLNALYADAIGHISALPSHSHGVITAFHLVEHISFDQLQSLVSEAMRVLKPGGLLIMETPNPENIAVSTCNFYLDPTHQRPIPPTLLAFVAEYAGFSRVKTLRLQESKDIIKQMRIGLHDIICEVSPDYAIVAQKHASDDIIALTSDPFDIEYGLNLDSLLSRYDSWVECIESKAQEAESKALLSAS